MKADTARPPHPAAQVRSGAFYRFQLVFWRLLGARHSVGLGPTKSHTLLRAAGSPWSRMPTFTKPMQ